MVNLSQCRNLHVLHTKLREVVQGNLVHGYARRASPQEVQEHNEVVQMTRALLASDPSSADEEEAELDEKDDFEFYHVNQAAAQRDKQGARGEEELLMIFLLILILVTLMWMNSQHLLDLTQMRRMTHHLIQWKKMQILMTHPCNDSMML